MREILVVPGKRIVTASGKVAVVAFVCHGQVFVYGPDGMPMPDKVVSDAYGGEHDQTMGIAA